MSENFEIQQSEENRIDFLDLLQTVVDNLRLIVSGSIGAGLLALSISFFITPSYSAKTQFLPPQQQQSSASALIQSLGSMGGLAAATGIKNPADQYIAFMKSQSVLDAMIERFNLHERYGIQLKIDARNILLSNTKIQASKESIIQLEVEDKDPVFAAELANGYVTELTKLMSKLSLSEAQLRRVFFEKKIIEAKEELAQADKSLRTTGISADTLKSSPLAAVEVVAKLKGSITAQEIKIGSMRGYLTEYAPEIKQAMIELNILKEQVAKAEKDEPAKSLGRLEDSYIERYREYKYKETLYEMFAKQYELARVDEAREGVVIQVIDSAQPPERKSKPLKALIAIITAISTCFLLILFVFVRQAIHDVDKNSKMAEKLKKIKRSWDKALGRK